jgi:ribonucleoside-diphosphate reductase beta chain
MKGTAEQFQYIMRDEIMHYGFGMKVVKQIIKEEDLTLDPRAVSDMWHECEAAENAYAKFILPQPIMGYNAEDHTEQFRYLANRRAKQLNFIEPFLGAKNALPWLNEQASLRKEKNFFETRVTEYQTGASLDW